jgi:hypothetical protein
MEISDADTKTSSIPIHDLHKSPSFQARCEDDVVLVSAELQVGHLRCCFKWKKMLSVRPFCHSIAITSCVTDPFI